MCFHLGEVHLKVQIPSINDEDLQHKEERYKLYFKVRITEDLRVCYLELLKDAHEKGNVEQKSHQIQS